MRNHGGFVLGVQMLGVLSFGVEERWGKKKKKKKRIIKKSIKQKKVTKKSKKKKEQIHWQVTIFKRQLVKVTKLVLLNKY